MRLAWLTALSIFGAAESAAAPAGDWVSAWRSTHEAQVIRTLADYSAVQSIAENPAALRTMATTLRDALAQRGFATRLLEAGAGAPPVVFAEFKTPGARRTVVFYAHYDGQPVTPSDWHSRPFEPVLRKTAAPDSPVVDLRSLPNKIDPEWRLFGRAASDDKSSIVAFLSAWDALKASGRPPSINIKVFWEGEEERSSPHLTQYLNQYQSDLAADLWLIGDATWHQSRKPTIYFGARGILSAQLKVYGPRRPLHSGYYGNWAPNPAFMLAKLFTDLRNSDGSVNIPGFNEDVLPLRPAERRAIAALPSVEIPLKADAGIAVSERGDDVVTSTMRPTLNIKSFHSGAAVNAIPASAEALVDFRLVPNQTPERARLQVEARLRALGWTIVADEPDETTRLRHAKIVRLNWDTGYPAYRSDMTLPVSRAVLRAASAASGEDVAVLPMIGGSVPIYLIDDSLHVPVIGLPIQNHDNNQHAADENARVGNLWDGIATYAAMFTLLDW